MENLEIFKNEEFGEVRVVTIDGEPWFVGKDIAKILGYSNTRDAILKHVDYEDKNIRKINTSGGAQDLTIINESGFYSLVLSSKQPKAKELKRWIIKEVLSHKDKFKYSINNVDFMINTYFANISDKQKELIKGLLVNIENQSRKIVFLTNENSLLLQKDLKWADRQLIDSLVCAYASSINGDFAKAWNNFKKELLYKHGINLNARITNYLNTTGKRTKPKTLEMIDDSELANAISTAVSLCRENDVNIDELLNNKAN